MTTEVAPSSATAAPPAPGGGRPRRRRTARWVAGIALVVVVAVVAVLATRPSYQAEEALSPLVGHQAPPISTTTVTGQRFSLAAERGRWVILNFFASWCVPCQEEEPELVAFAYQHRQAGGPLLVSVVFEDTDAAAAAFQRAEGATWPTLTDPGTKIALAYGVTSPPETFLISPTGVVAAHIYGAVTTSFLDRQLARAERSFG
ncbi:TlpA family protein disulfide reductase [Aciditerrimonas ferrireducens]|jgi:cytochrome c biogenesis protein CcmG/thiol:disulfide interchange protein DsbE|uniref:TlpA family protein disulfide reductase n=1 Tax=Aciditerrimonas ferrireducens TaxID=667306 RepID=UPI002005D4D0|nr:TlpA disulfide reductase family protein [Aciditerrimonas ferrireducens]MCK4177018.1 TlpA family protein disulfide reductase [Aciditerrimonas ferrireducens]